MAALNLVRLAGLAFATLVVAPMLAEPDVPSLGLPESGRPIRLVEHLLVNSSNVERFVTLTRCESDGIIRIRDLMIHSPIEELWAFIPGAEDGAGCRWIEIGGEVRSESEHSSVKVDWPYLSQLIARFDDIQVYHFHPLSYFERCVSGQRCNGYTVPLSAEGVSAEGLVNNLKFAMPSPGDIYFMMETSWQFQRNHGNSESIRHRLVTPYGVVEYVLTALGMAKYAEHRSTRMEGLYIKLVAANALSDESIMALAAEYPKDLGKAVQKLAESMTGIYLRVELLSP